MSRTVAYSPQARFLLEYPVQLRAAQPQDLCDGSHVAMLGSKDTLYAPDEGRLYDG